MIGQIISHYKILEKLGRCRTGVSFFLLDTLPALRDGTVDFSNTVVKVTRRYLFHSNL